MFTQKGDCLDTNVGEDDEGQPFTITDSQGNGCNVYTSDDVSRCGHYDDEENRTPFGNGRWTRKRVHRSHNFHP